MKHYMVTAFVSLPDEWDFTDGVNEAWIGVTVRNDYGPYGSVSKWDEDMVVEWLDIIPTDEEGNYVEAS